MVGEPYRFNVEAVVSDDEPVQVHANGVLEKVRLPDGKVIKAWELNGLDNLLFRRNSQTGAIELRVRTGSWGGLNDALHKN